MNGCDDNFLFLLIKTIINTMRTHLYILISLFIVMLSSSFAFSAMEVKHDRFLIPYVKNYSKKDYKGANQNWDVAQADNGVMYFANSDGLIEYDGALWNLFTLPDKQIIRSVEVDKKGRVYIGAHEEFGYWERNTKGQLEYVSLVDKVAPELIKNQDFWAISVIGDKVYFQSFARIFRFDGKHIQTLNTPANIFTIFNINDRLLASVDHVGIFTIENDSLVLMEGSQFFAPQTINVVLPYSEEGFLVGTESGGLFLFQNNKMTPWENEASSILKAAKINKGARVKLNNQYYYVFGTITQGIIILDQNGKIYNYLDKIKGLQNNTILGLKVDHDDNLWIGSDNGIDYVNLNSEFKYYRDRDGELGTVYSAAVYQDKLYIGTNHGLFSADWNSTELNLSSDFSFVENTQGQVWDLSVIDGVLFCGHNSGTFTVTNSGLQKISDVSGGWILRKVPNHPDLLIQGTYIGLVVYKKIQGKWRMSHMVSGFHEPTEFLEFDYKGNLWASHAYRGLYRLQLNASLTSVLTADYYGADDGLQEDYNVNVFKVDQQIVFTTRKQLFSYDYTNEKIVPYKTLNRDLEDLQSAHKIIPVDKNHYWFFNKEKYAKVTLNHGKLQRIDALSFQLLRGSTLSGYENIVALGKRQYLICLDDGFSVFVDKKNEEQVLLDRSSVLFRKISCGSQTSKKQIELHLGQVESVHNSNNNLYFEFSLPVYNYGRINYQWKLEGYDSFWTDPIDATRAKYNKLPYGDYLFKVRAMDTYGNVSSISEYRFKILPPWYLSIYAKIAYVVIFFLLIVVVRMVYYRKLEKQKKLIGQRLKHENEKHIIKLKNDHLRDEVENKSREIANYTMMVTKKNELLTQLKEHLEKLEKSVVTSAAKKSMFSINKLIDAGINNQDHWSVFNENFDDANKTFFLNLKKIYPQLTPHDLRFCAFLKINMTTKEIASFLNISPRSVEVKRYRLRKKLNLEHDQNLVEFIMSLSDND